MVRITSILILISISTLARASDWKYLGTNIEGTVVYVDAESLLAEGDKRTYWAYVKLKEPQTVFDKVFYATKSQESINCTKRTTTMLVSQFLDSQGKVVHYEYAQQFPQTKAMSIIPDSMQDAIRNYVCSINKSAG
jgi:hypothetical protein